MMSWIFRNKAVFYSLLILLAVFTVLTAAGTFILCRQSQSMTRAFIRQDIALVGGMARNEPASGLSILTGKTSPEDLKAGENLLQKYSFDRQLPVGAVQYYHSLFQTQLIVFWLTAGLFAALSLALFLALLSRQHAKICVLTRAASAPDFSGGATVSGEGDLPALENAIGALAGRTGFYIRKLKRDKEYLKDLLSDISHQLKTPLAALRMYNDILLDKPGLEEQKRMEFLTRSKRQIDRTDWLIQGLLKMARVEAGAVEMNRRNGCLADTVEQAICPFRETAIRQGVSLAAGIPPEIRFPHDGEWVAEAVGNIVKNALEHTPNGGTIRLSANETPLTVELTVEDDGEGMTSEEIPHIFERFYHKNAGVNTASAGIGLSLAREIVEKNGGEIYVKSAPGHGSRFTLTFLTKGGKISES